MRFVLTRTWLGCAIISHPCEVCPGDELRPPRQFYFYFQFYLRPITDDKSRKKRKRLHEEYSGELQEVLNKLILETFPSLLGCDLFSFKETSQRDSYICGECCNKLSQVSRLQEQLQKVKNYICQKLSSLYILECGHKCHNTQQQTPCNCDA